MHDVDDRVRRAADRWERALRTVRSNKTLRARSLWLLSSSLVILPRPHGLIRGGAPDARAACRPTLILGQPVRHVDRTEIGVFVVLLFGPADEALVRWADGSTFETPEDLLEVVISSARRRANPASPPPASPTAGS